MWQEQIIVVISLLFGIALLKVLSNKLKVSYPILLVIAGLAVSLIPGVPYITLNPDLVFLIFLPPLLYAAAGNISWHEFWKWKRPILLLAFGLVIFTSASVALISNAIIPGFTLALGFLLGGIISPPDAIAASSVLHGLKAPRRNVSILEGESLINDASSLVVFRFALAAILTDQFYFWNAARTFLLVVIMGIAIGLLIAITIYFIHKLLATTARIDAVITLISPYIMYITAEHFHFSGVLAVVSGGLLLSYRSREIFTYESRLQLKGLWEVLIFLLNGLVFILIGLQLPVIINGLESYSIGEAIFYGIIISLGAIAIRLIWIFPAAHIPRILFKSIRETEPYPTWRTVFLTGWSGMRGVVSLAAALAIPLTLTDGTAFPHRNLILFITFVVILFTLVLQGLALKPLIIFLNLPATEKEDERLQGIQLRIQLAESALTYLDTNYPEETQHHETYKRVRDRYERMIDIAKRKLEFDDAIDESAIFLPHYRQMLIELVHIRRRELNYLRHKGEFTLELIREREWELDIEEARLRN